jgi:hypothetical protein
MFSACHRTGDNRYRQCIDLDFADFADLTGTLIAWLDQAIMFGPDATPARNRHGRAIRGSSNV